jgi:hypothetical protein
MDFYAKIIFLNASTLGSTFILLNSTSSRFPNGLGNGGDQLGCNLMDHQYRAGADARWMVLKMAIMSAEAKWNYIPRFRNIGNDKRTDYIRGGYQGAASRAIGRGSKRNVFGEELKDSCSTQADGVLASRVLVNVCRPATTV